jgi:hypothetical protein
MAEQGTPAFQAAIPMLSQRLKAGTAEREVRSMACQVKIARFPAYRDLAGFDFTSSEVNVMVRRNWISALATSRRVAWKRRSSRFLARLNQVPMYFSNMASVASDNRVSRLAA